MRKAFGGSLAVAAVTVALAAPAANAQKLSPEAAKALAAEYVPTFHFDAAEDWWPISIDYFIKRSELKWKALVKVKEVPRRGLTADCSKRIAKRGKINPSRLGGRGGKSPYTAFKREKIYGGGCFSLTEGRKYRATQFTRPFDTARARPPELGDDQGFALNLANSAHDQSKPPTAQTPIYYQYGYKPGNGHWVRYFVMYACSAVPGGGIGGPANTQGPIGTCWHEGEWEGLTVFFGEDLTDGPEEVFYNEHFAGTRAIGWWNVLKSGASPRVWVAEATHAGYPYPDDPHSTCNDKFYGCFGKDFADGNGPTWKPEVLVDVETQPWFGFGGSWGDALSKPRTGPSGPGHPIRKAGFPSPWASEPASFPKGYRRWCDTGWYPASDELCVREIPDDVDQSVDDPLTRLLDLDCPDAPAGGDRLPTQFFGFSLQATAGVGELDPHGLDGDRDGVGCEPADRTNPGASQYFWEGRALDALMDLSIGGNLQDAYATIDPGEFWTADPGPPPVGENCWVLDDETIGADTRSLVAFDSSAGGSFVSNPDGSFTFTQTVNRPYSELPGAQIIPAADVSIDLVGHLDPDGYVRGTVRFNGTWQGFDYYPPGAECDNEDDLALDTGAIPFTATGFSP